MTGSRKVMRVDKAGGSAVMLEEKTELDKVQAELVGVNCATEEEIIEAAQEADVIITEGARMTRRVMEGLSRCQAIIRYGIGYDTIDIGAANDNNIVVVNIPDFCFEEVANHALSFLLILSKKMFLMHKLMKEGRWAKAHGALPPMGAVHEETLGIIGTGNIGRTVARKAQCFKFRILGYDPYVDKTLAKDAGITLTPMSQVLQESDYLTLHPLLNQETRHLIGEKELKQMKPSAYLINTSRGPVVDEVALIKAIRQKWIAGAGLDVFEKEPIDPDNPLLKMDNVIVTPHSASYSDVAFRRLRTCVGQEAARVVAGRWPKNVVNKTVKPKVKLAKEG